MKQIIKLNGAFLLIDPVTKQEIDYKRPFLVFMTSFISQRASLGQLSVLASNVDDSKTDADWAEHFKACDGDVDLAISSFITPPVDESVVAVEKKRTRKT